VTDTDRKIPYDAIVTSVSDRADLLARTLGTMMDMLDQPPERLIVHEDVRPGTRPGLPRADDALEEAARRHGVRTRLIRTDPGTGLSLAMLRLLEEASTEFVLYTQEDFDFVRRVPVSDCLDTMRRHNLTHVRFNKRDTLAVKGAHRPPHERWTKREVELDGRKLCVSDHVYFQANLTRRAVLLEGFKELLLGSPGGVARCEAAFNRWFNQKHGQGAGSADGDQDKRERLLRTFIWGGVGEPRFVAHTGAERRTQGWRDPAHEAKHGGGRGPRR
jgi:hypothetical protein